MNPRTRARRAPATGPLTFRVTLESRPFSVAEVLAIQPVFEAACERMRAAAVDAMFVVTQVGGKPVPPGASFGDLEATADCGDQE